MKNAIRVALSSLLACVVLGSATKSLAATVTYSGPNYGDWGTAGNWSSGQVPDSSSDVVIDARTVLTNLGTQKNVNSISLLNNYNSVVRVYGGSNVSNSLMVTSGSITGVGSLISNHANSSASFNAIQATSVNLGTSSVLSVDSGDGTTPAWLTIGSGMNWTVYTSIIATTAGEGNLRVNGGTLTISQTQLAYGLILGQASAGTGNLVLDGGTVFATRIGISRQQAGFTDAGQGSIKWSGGTIRNLAGTDLLLNSYEVVDNTALQIQLLGTETKTLTADSGRVIRVGAASINQTGTNTSGAYFTGSTGTLVVDGGGRVELYQANPYTGTIQVKSGTLKLMNGSNTFNGATADYNASISATTLLLGSSATTGVLDLIQKTSGYTFGSTQSVQGNGTIRMANDATAVTISGTLAPGFSAAGTLSIEGDLALTSTSVSLFEVTSFTLGGYGLIQGVGSGFNNLVAFDGTLRVTFSGISQKGSIKLFDFDTYSGNFDAFEYSGLDAGWSASFDETTGDIAVVPEPGTTALIGCGIAVVLFAGRPRSRDQHSEFVV